jgi:hypothetical protein
MLCGLLLALPIRTNVGRIRVQITVLGGAPGAGVQQPRRPAVAAPASPAHVASLAPTGIAGATGERPSRLVSSRGGRQALDLDIVPQRAAAQRIAFLQRRADTALARALKRDAPEPVPPIVVHVVQPGETLWEIAYIYRTDLAALMAAHAEIVPGLMPIGTVLHVPVPPAASTRPS